MKVLKVIHDQEPKGEGYQERHAVRAVILDDKGKIPLLFLAKYNFHSLPGGGIEESETTEQALIREIKEETGCQINLIKPIGRIIEYRSVLKAKRINDAYLGTVTQKGTPMFTEGEIADVSQLVWKNLDEAIQTIESDEPNIYKGLFIQQRDLTFLKEAQRVINSQKPENSHMVLKKTELSAKGTLRSNIKSGLKVAIVLKKDQPTGKLTQGVVKDILTSSAEHHRGIKVRLQDGQVGRVQQIFN